MIVLDCREGLANRMQAIESAHALSLKIKKKLVVLWCTNGALGARYSDLFEEAPSLTAVAEFETVSNLNAFVSSLNPTLTINHFLDPYPLIDNTEMYLHMPKPKAIASEDVVYIRTWARFYLSRTSYRSFIPNNFVAENVENISGRFKNTIGVHIRRGGHRDAIRCTPSDKFHSTLENLIRVGRADNFFLSTDDPDVERSFSERFPTIIYSKRCRNRSDPIAIQDALIDLYCLSRTSEIVGSAGSTFSFVASQISAIPLYIPWRDDLAPSYMDVVTKKARILRQKLMRAF